MHEYGPRQCIKERVKAGELHPTVAWQMEMRGEIHIGHKLKRWLLSDGRRAYKKGLKEQRKAS